MSLIPRANVKVRSLLAGCVLAACQSIVSAGVTFSSATAKWTFDADTAGGSQQKSVNVIPPAGSSLPTPPSFQLKQTYTSGSGATTATAFGSIGYVANATTATFTLSPGTGVSQNDPGNAYPGDSLVRVDFDGFFNPTAPSFGPPATGYVSVAVGGVVGTGGYSKFAGEVNFLNGNTSAALRPQVKFSQTFNVAGSFAQTFTSSALMSPSSIPVGTPVRVKGFFEFRASNAILPSSILPLDVEFGGAPPTATWYSSNNGNWSNANNWRAPDGSVIDDPDRTIPDVPDGIGQRARILSLGVLSRNIVLDRDITLGALDIDAAGDFALDSDGRFGLNLRTGLNDNNGPATIHARNLSGDSLQNINAPITLGGDLDIMTEGTYQGPRSAKPAANVLFNKRITGGRGAIRKSGRGTAQLNASNSFSGGTVVDGGRLEANVEGSLGSGNVLADNGLLAYNAVHAVAAGALIQADNGGQIDLGVAPAENETFDVGAFGVISGSSAELARLNAAANGNLRLSSGATIAHETFDFTIQEGNPQSLGDRAQYIFGIAADFDSNVGPQRVITVGTESNSPWKGFGSDRFDRFFGTDPRSDHEILQISGDAEIRALDETLTLNGQVTSISGTSSLTKTGAGAVAINNEDNNFRAPITVKQGALLVNGRIHGVTRLSVDDGATLGGRGTIEGNVALRDLARLAPGDNTPDGHIGTLRVGPLAMSERSELDFELNEAGVVGEDVNDFLLITGDLLLDGIINIFDAGNFGPGSYTLIQYTGELTDLGLELGYFPDDGLVYKLGFDSLDRAIGGGSLMLTVTVPEPGSVLWVAALGAGGILRRRPRSQRV